MLEILQPILGDAAGIVIKILTIIGTLRLFIKPVMSMIDAFVRADKNPANDDLVQKIESNKIFKVIVYCLDWLASVKVVKKK